MATEPNNDRAITLDYAPSGPPLSPWLVRAKFMSSWGIVGLALLIGLIGGVILPSDTRQHRAAHIVAMILLMVSIILLVTSFVATFVVTILERRARKP